MAIIETKAISLKLIQNKLNNDAFSRMLIKGLLQDCYLNPVQWQPLHGGTTLGLREALTVQAPVPYAQEGFFHAFFHGCTTDVLVL